MEKSTLPMIGITEFIEVENIKLPAKIDTGAETSAIWASNVKILPDKTLEFILFDEKSEHYTGEKIHKENYGVNIIRSSNGHEQVRYRVQLNVKIAGVEFTTDFTLANRSKNQFPVLIGKIALSGRFLIDPSKTAIQLAKNPDRTSALEREFKDDPHKFHDKYKPSIGDKK